MATGGSGPVPASKPLPSAIHQGLAAPKPAGITARIRFTNGLFPNGALLGQVGSALMSGASGRLWMRDDGRGRLELQSNAGDVQIVWKQGQATVYDASSNTVYRIKLPAGQRQAAAHAPPSVAGIGAFLAQFDEARECLVGPAVERRRTKCVHGSALAQGARRPARLGAARVGCDARRASTRCGLRARRDEAGARAPDNEHQVPVGAALDGRDRASAGAKVVNLAAPSGRAEGKSGARQAKPPFQVVAPDSLAGLKHT